MDQHNLKQLMEPGLCVTVNSDDPAYFGGYMAENFAAVESALGLTPEQLVQLAKNSFKASFLSPAEQQLYLQELSIYN